MYLACLTIAKSKKRTEEEEEEVGEGEAEEAALTTHCQISNLKRVCFFTTKRQIRKEKKQLKLGGYFKPYIYKVWHEFYVFI